MFPHVGRIWALWIAKIPANSSLSDMSRHLKFMMDIKLAPNMPICSRVYLWNCRFKLWLILDLRLALFPLLTWICVLMDEYLRSFAGNIRSKFGFKTHQVKKTCQEWCNRDHVGSKRTNTSNEPCISVFFLRMQVPYYDLPLLFKHQHIVPRSIFPQESPHRLAIVSPVFNGT